jgi:hypothetical protein
MKTCAEVKCAKAATQSFSNFDAKNLSAALDVSCCADLKGLAVRRDAG